MDAVYINTRIGLEVGEHLYLSSMSLKHLHTCTYHQHCFSQLHNTVVHM